MVARLSADNRFEEFFIMTSAEGRPIIGRQSADDRQTVGRWHFIKDPSADRRRISAVIRPMIARLSADHKLWFVLYCLQCMYPHYLWNYILHLFYFWIHFIWPRVQVISGFCVGFPIELFIWRFEINVCTTSKRLQPNSGHSHIWIELSVWSFEIKVSISSNYKSNFKHSLIYSTSRTHNSLFDNWYVCIACRGTLDWESFSIHFLCWI